MCVSETEAAQGEQAAGSQADGGRRRPGGADCQEEEGQGASTPEGRVCVWVWVCGVHWCVCESDGDENGGMKLGGPWCGAYIT